MIGDYEVQVWQNDGTPFDALWAPNDVGNADAVLTLVIGDLDNDGINEIVLSTVTKNKSAFSKGKSFIISCKPVSE